MAKVRTARELGPDDWVGAGMRALAVGGVEAVRVEVLARALGVTKGSFYWHFVDRGDLLAALIRRWEADATTAVIAAVEAGGGTGATRLRRLVRRCFAGGDIDRLESAIRRWGSSDRGVGPVLARVDATRLAYVAGLLVEHGLAPADARARARMLYLAMIGEFTWTAHGGAPTPRATLAALSELLLSSTPAAPRSGR